MDTRLPVNHYLFLREQGVTHEAAFSGTLRRYGVGRLDLRSALEQSLNHHRALVSLLLECEEPR